MKIEKNLAQSPKGEITLYTLTNASGAQVTLSSLGAGIVSVIVPDKNGDFADVVLGYKNPASYIYDGPCAGKIPGRFANRIASGISLSTAKSTHSQLTMVPTPFMAVRKDSRIRFGTASLKMALSYSPTMPRTARKVIRAT